jgi:hypothetical protein
VLLVVIAAVAQHDVPSPVLGHATPVTHNDATPVTHGATPVTHNDATPVTHGSTPVTHEATPVTHEATPVVGHDATPVTHNHATPVTHEATPVTHEATPVVGHDATPVTHNHATPVTHEATPVAGHDATPVANHEATVGVDRVVNEVNSGHVSTTSVNTDIAAHHDLPASYIVVVVLVGQASKDAHGHASFTVDIDISVSGSSAVVTLPPADEAQVCHVLLSVFSTHLHVAVNDFTCDLSPKTLKRGTAYAATLTYQDPSQNTGFALVPMAGLLVAASTAVFNL